MEKKIALLSLPAILAMLALSAGCAGKEGETVSRLPEIGFSMELPPGWTTHGENHNFFSSRRDRERRRGFVHYLPAGGRSLDGFVDHLLAMDREEADEEFPASEVIARTGRIINGVDAVELDLINPEGKRLYSIFKKRGDNILRVTFSIEEAGFAAKEDALFQATETIAFR